MTNDKPIARTPIQFSSLRDALAALKSGALSDRDATSIEPLANPEYANHQGVWCWDDTHKIVGTGRGDFSIVAISPGEHKQKRLTISET